MPDDQSYLKGQLDSLQASTNSRFESMEANVEKRFEAHHDKYNAINNMINTREEKMRDKLSSIEAILEVHGNEHRHINEFKIEMKDGMGKLNKSLDEIKDAVVMNRTRILAFGIAFGVIFTILNSWDKLMRITGG